MGLYSSTLVIVTPSPLTRKPLARALTFSADKVSSATYGNSVMSFTNLSILSVELASRTVTFGHSASVLLEIVIRNISLSSRIAPQAAPFLHISFQDIATPLASSNRVRASPAVKAVTVSGIASNSAVIVISLEVISIDVSAVADSKDAGLVHFEN